MEKSNVNIRKDYINKTLISICIYQTSIISNSLKMGSNQTFFCGLLVLNLANNTLMGSINNSSKISSLSSSNHAENDDN